ncbi:hypothetical protein ACH3XW_17745 [Acanthocheilonema viteae]
MDAPSSSSTSTFNSSSEHIWDMKLMKEELNEIEYVDLSKMKNTANAMIKMWEDIDRCIETIIIKTETDFTPPLSTDVIPSKNSSKLREITKIGERSKLIGKKRFRIPVFDENYHYKNCKFCQHEIRPCFVLRRRPIRVARLVRR